MDRVLSSDLVNPYHLIARFSATRVGFAKNWTMRVRVQKIDNWTINLYGHNPLIIKTFIEMGTKWGHPFRQKKLTIDHQKPNKGK